MARPIGTPDTGDTLSALRSAFGVDVNALSEEGRHRLFLLDQVLRARGVTGGTITSGRRSSSVPSQHTSGNAIDIVLPGDMASHAEDLQQLGFRAAFERKGQRNPNGSVATGDHIHVTLIGGTPAAPPKAQGFAAAFEPTAAPTAPPKARGFAAAFEPSPEGQGGFAAAFEPPAPARASVPLATPTPTPTSSSLRVPQRPALSDINPLTLGLPAPRMTSRDRAPALTTSAEVSADIHSGNPARMLGGVWKLLVKSGHGINATTNEMAFRNRLGGLAPAAIAGIYHTLVGNHDLAQRDFAKSGYDVRGLGHAFAQAFQDANGAVPFEGFRTAIGPNAPAGLRVPGAVGDFLLGMRVDPANYAVGAATGVAGKGIAALARTPVGQAVVGQAAGAAARLGQSAPVQATLRAVGRLQPQGTLPGMGTVRSLIPTIKAPEWAKAPAGLYQKAVALVKQGYLSGPSTVVANAVSNVAAAEQELTRRGISAVGLAKNALPAKQELAQLRKGVLTPDTRELLPLLQGTQYAQNVPAGTFGALKGLAKNPILEAHGRNEAWTKLTLYKALKAGGVSPQDARAAVTRALFNYDDRSWLLQQADKNGLWVFNTFPLKATELFFRTLRDDPNLVLRYPNLQRHLLESTYTKQQYDALPPDKKGTFVVPWGTTGRFIDLSRWHPLASSVDTARELVNAAAEGRAPALFGKGKNALPSWAEALNKTIYGTFISGIAAETQSGTPDYERRIGFEGAPPGQRMQDTAWYWARNLLPPVRHGLNIAAAARGVTPEQKRRGEAVPLGEAIARGTIGVAPFRPEDEATRDRRLAAAQDRRFLAARSYADTVGQQFQAGRLKGAYGPFVREFAGETDPKALTRTVNAAKLYYVQQTLSTGNITAQGQITDAGKRRIRDALLRLQAAGARLDELARQQMQAPSR